MHHGHSPIVLPSPMPLPLPTLGHLAVEATRLVHERRGIGRYVRSMLPEFAVQRPALRFTLFVAHRRDIAALREELSRLHPSLNTRTWIETVDRLPHTDAGVAWYPWNFISPPAHSATCIATVHDIAPMLQLDHRWWKVLKRAKYRARYGRTLDRAHGVLAISHFTREELLDKTDADPTRITVTPLAADDLPIDVADDVTPLEDARVSGPFFLTVGGQDGRKNLTTVYAAMDALWARGVRVPLVQCGPSLARETRDRIGRAPWLRHVGFVNDAQLVTLYRRCSALVYPSRYEGFGLPVLEAMRMGAPVICSSESSLPEVAGAAAQYVRWDDAEEMSRTMERMASEPALRAALGAAGRQRAALFSWRSTAAQTLMVFEATTGARRVVDEPLATPRVVPVGSPEPLTAPAVIRAATGLHGAHDA
ncbi:glycosyltransferase family 4 protein [Gemmatimonas sp.]|uniref:glycosyltransferase family 4 protein n=1 Tax=Gemmatimonas sp. TaxID=1962908 RepID=UPI0037C0925D